MLVTVTTNVSRYFSACVETMIAIIIITLCGEMYWLIFDTQPMWYSTRGSKSRMAGRIPLNECVVVFEMLYSNGDFVVTKPARHAQCMLLYLVLVGYRSYGLLGAVHAWSCDCWHEWEEKDIRVIVPITKFNSWMLIWHSTSFSAVVTLSNYFSHCTVFSLDEILFQLCMLVCVHMYPCTSPTQMEHSELPHNVAM